MTDAASARRGRRQWPGHLVLPVLAVLAGVTGCSSPPPKEPPPQAVTLRLGYLPELADAPVLAGLQMGFIGSGAGGVSVDPVPFTSAVTEAQALARGQLDAAYLDPVLAIAAWQSSGDSGIKVIAGSASGGAELVARSGITSAAQLAGQRVAAPPDTAGEAALDWWLRQNGVDADWPGNVTMTGTYLAHAIGHGQLAAAWEPAPQDAQMAAAGGQVLVNEASLWPGGQFATAVLAVTSKFLATHPAAVTQLLSGDLAAIRYLNTDPSPAHAAAARQLTEASRSALPAKVLAAAFTQVQFTDNPMPETMFAEAQHAASAGMVRPVPSLRALAGLFDLGPLNRLLKAARQPLVNP
jgi:NitT/TauT family transport system substrate-binding protein